MSLANFLSRNVTPFLPGEVASGGGVPPAGAQSSLADFFDRIGTNFSNNISDAGPMGLASLGAAIASAPRNQWGSAIAQGLGGMVQMAQAERKKRTLADALQGAMGDLTPQQKAFLGAIEPDQAAQLVGSNLFKAPTEKWEQIDTNGDGVPDRQRSSLTGKVDDIPLSLADRERLARAGASSTTINNMPAELGARVGLGEGFLRDYDNLQAKVKKFFGGPPAEQLKRRGQILFGTGEGAELWRAVEAGKESLVRNLTGAGMAQAEAENQASRYAISQWDTEFDALSKLAGLKRDLENVARGAYKARGGTYTPPSSGKDNSDVDAILGLK